MSCMSFYWTFDQRKYLSPYYRCVQFMFFSFNWTKILPWYFLPYFFGKIFVVNFHHLDTYILLFSLFKFDFSILFQPFSEAKVKLVFIRFITSIDILPINVNWLDIFLLFLFSGTKEWFFEATVYDIEHGSGCKKFWKIFNFYLTNWMFNALPFFYSFNYGTKIFVIHEGRQFKFTFALRTCFFVLLLNLKMHIVVLLHDLFNQVGRSGQKHILLPEYLIDVQVDTSFPHTALTDHGVYFFLLL